MRNTGSAVVAVPLLLSAILAIGCRGPNSGTPGARDAPNSDDKVVNLYIWSDYLAPDTLAGFEKQTGITVRVSYFDNLETLESRMLTGHSGFDVVVPTGVFIQRQIRSGAHLSLDKYATPSWSEYARGQRRHAQNHRRARDRRLDPESGRCSSLSQRQTDVLDSCPILA